MVSKIYKQVKIQIRWKLPKKQRKLGGD